LKTAVSKFLNLFIGLLSLCATSPAFSFDFFDYQLGFDYSQSFNVVNATYEVESNDSKLCEDSSNPGKRKCHVQMGSGGSNGIIRGWGIFLQPAFKRQGDIYFDWGLSFGARYISGELEDLNSSKAPRSTSTPLNSMSYSLFSVLAKPYIKFGVTPAKKWPDLLISVGPMAQALTGKVEVNDETETAAMAATSNGFLNGFWEVEIVVWRFGEGALSLYYLEDAVKAANGSKFFRKDVEGIDEIYANFSHTTNGGFGGYGLKILTTWP